MTNFFATVGSLALLLGLAARSEAAPGRPTPPTRDPITAGYVAAKELPDGEVPPADADGNFIVGPTHKPAPETTVQEGVPQGEVFEFTMESTDSKIYPGIAREKDTFGTPDPDNPAKLLVTTSHPAPYTRKVAVYVPKQYVAGTEAPFIVGADGPDKGLFTVLDNLIAQKRVPTMVAISIANGSGDAQGSQRGLEYDTMSGQYAEWVETEVLPLVEAKCNVKLTKDPDGRATMGCSSGASCAMIMAWYHPELYHRVLSFSGTFVNQQWPHNPETPGGAWEFHKSLIPNSPPKPIRIWMEVGDRDLLNPNTMRDEMHDWVVANENMAKALADKGYHYQFAFVRDAGHCDGAMKKQLLPEALEYVWKGYTGGSTTRADGDKATLEPAGAGWIPIWNRDSLTGWKAEADFWKLEKDGALHGHTPGLKEHHYAYTETEYADFEMHADFKLVGNNTGICIRIAPTSFDNVPGYQVDVGDGYWGCLWDERGRGMVAQFPKESAEKIVKKDDWNHYYIRAEGHHIQAWLNGTKTFDVVDEKGLLSGPIGFQLCHGEGKVTDATFKNVVVRPLKP